jgi:hypothetical protein
MFRLALVLVLLAGVAHAAPTDGDATSKQTTTSKKSSAKKSDTSKKQSSEKSEKRTSARSDKRTSEKSDKKSDKRTAKKSSKKDKNAARVPWLPSRSTLANNEGMPPGFSWPPTRAMLAAEGQCEAKLDRAGVVWERGQAEGRIANPIIVPAMTFGGIRYTNMWGSKGPHVLDCQLALALETIGPELYAIGVREVKFGSLFRWSHVRSHGVTRPLLSRHGIGLAMDIGSFVDESGREAVVETDYKAGDQLLLAIEQVVNANGNFRILLTPKNDPISHHNHFHIEARSDYRSPDVP